MNARLAGRGAGCALATTIVALAAAIPARAAQRVAAGSGFTRTSAAVAAVPANVATARRSERAKLGPLGLLQVQPGSGAIRDFGRLDGLLTSASSRPAADIALDYVRARPAIFGLDATDLAGLKLVHDYSAAGIEQVRWEQSYDGIPSIDSALTANLTANGRLVNVVGAPVHDLAPDAVTPSISAEDAYAAAARGVGGPARAARSASSSAQRTTSFAGGGSAKLVIYDAALARLGWRLLMPVDGTHVYDVVVDASTGVVQRAQNLVKSVAVTGHIYRNYPGAPVGGTAENIDLSPYVTSATTLLGPDAHTFTDAQDTVHGPDDPIPTGPGVEVVPGTYDISDPNTAGCMPLVCIWKAGTPNSWAVNRSADAEQLQWFVSNFHDYLEKTPAIAFDAAAGNFDGSDRLLAQNMDGANTEGGLPDSDHVDNANMATYPDGTSPEMQMYLTDTPTTHPASTAFDAAVVYHEYSHGLVERTIDDATGFGALGGAQGGALDEGLADFYSIDYLVGQGLETDVAATPDVTFGKFAFGGELRTEPTDCPVPTDPSILDATCNGGDTPHYGGYTYADFGHVAGDPEVHADGEIWTQTMWQLRQLLISRSDAAGDAEVRQLMTNGMRLAPPNPSFLDLRNAVLQAAAASLPTTIDDIWTVFADRGMGYFASTTDASDLSPIADTHMPPATAAATGTLSGTVTDAATGSPVAGITVAVAGHDSGVGPQLSATTSSSGAYTISTVAPGTYPLVRARGGGYAGQASNVAVAAGPAVTTQSFSLRRDVAAAAAGAQIASATGPDYSEAGCGPAGLIDEDPQVVWGTSTPSDPHFPGVKEIVVALPAATNLTAIQIDPAAGCGDDPSASLGQYEVLVSANGSTYTSVSSGTFSAADDGRDNAISLSTMPAGTRDVKLIAKTSQDASADGAGEHFIDVSELRAYGTPTPVVTPPPPPPAAITPPPPAVITPPPPPPPPPSPDITPPAFRLSGATIQKLGSSVKVSVTCPSEACTASARATIRVPATRGHKAKTYKLAATKGASVAKGRVVALTLKLASATRSAVLRALKAHKRVSASVAVTSKDKAGNSVTGKRRVRFKR
ncbi:MAG TPA: M36 family metallopeptidase [Solirubrobacteraceae bacterium]|jgi:hypothetical protein